MLHRKRWSGVPPIFLIATVRKLSVTAVVSADRVLLGGLGVVLVADVHPPFFFLGLLHRKSPASRKKGIGSTYWRSKHMAHVFPIRFMPLASQSSPFLSLAFNLL